MILACSALAGCASGFRPRSVTCVGDVDAVMPSAATNGTVETTLDVLTYNLEGLPWPARSGRTPQLREIGRILNGLRKSDAAPDIVLFQEAFSKSAVRAVEATGYPALVAGPSRTQRSRSSANVILPGHRKPAKGELGLRLLPSGLAIASRYPIVASVSDSYSRSSCAGFDCLANKGVVFARVAIPGLPAPVDIFDTHMNAQRASRVAPERHLAAHNAQAVELGAFLSRHWDRTNPVILGGDFNMRRAAARFEPFSRLQPLTLVHQFCVTPGSGCDVRMSWDGDEPWLDTQDLQLFASGKTIEIAPIRVTAMFDGRPESPQLSDHDGLRVVYRLRWHPAAGQTAIMVPPCAAVNGQGR